MIDEYEMASGLMRSLTQRFVAQRAVARKMSAIGRRDAGL